MNINIVLIAPEIPQNTGAIGRLCVCLDATLHLIEPLGFQLDEASLRRAGLDYWQYLHYCVYGNWPEFLAMRQPRRLFFASTYGVTPYYDFQFQENDFLIFGNETGGLPGEFYDRYRGQLYQIPMPGVHARSHNLANAVAIVAYEAYRQMYRT